MKFNIRYLLPAFIYLLAALPYNSFSQKQLFQKEILSSVLSKNEKRLALTGPDTVYIYSMPGFQLLHKWAHRRNTLLVEGFHPSNPDILITRIKTIPEGRNANLMQLDMMESDSKYWIHPEDSLLVWSVERKEIVQAMPGNYYMFFGAGTDKLAGIANVYNAFTANDGRQLYASRGATVYTKNGALEKESTAEKSVRALEVSEDLSHFATSWYKYSVDGLSYSFSIQDFTTHETVFEMNALPDLPFEFTFSPSGKYLAITGVWKKDENPTVKVIDVKKGKLLNEISGLVEQNYDKIFSLSFSMDENQVYATTRNNWKVFDLLTGSVQNKIEGRLLDMLFIQDAYKLNNQLYLVGSQFNPEGYTTNFGYISAVGNDYLQVYTKVNKAAVQSYADSTSFTMMVNSTLVDNTAQSIYFNPAKTFFTSTKESRMEVWEVTKRKKLLELGFDKNIKAFPSSDGKQILVIEDKGTASDGGFTMHNVKLSNSSIYTSPVITGEYSEMENNLYCDCVAKDDNTWLCIDGNEKIWEVRGNDFSIKETAYRQGAEFKKISFSGNTAYLLVDTDDVDTIMQWNNGKFIVQATAPAIEDFMVMQTNVVIRRSQLPHLEIWSDNKLVRNINLTSLVNSMDVSADGKYAIVDYSTYSKPGLLKLEEDNEEVNLQTKYTGGKFYMLDKDELLQFHDGFHSIFNNATYSIPWSVHTAQIFSNTNFDVSLNGNYILSDNLLINLKDVETGYIQKYSAANLLEDSAGIIIIDIVEDRYRKDAGFTLRRINYDKKDTVRSEEWIRVPQDELYGANVHDRIVTSDNKQWAVTYTEVSSIKSSKRPSPLLWNVAKLKSTPVPIDLTWVQFVPGKNEFIAYDGNKTFHYSVSPFKLISAKEDMRPVSSFVGSAEFTTVDNYKILLKEKLNDSMRTIQIFYSTENFVSSLYHKATKQVFGFTVTGKVYVWDAEGTGAPKKILQVHTTPFYKFIQRGDLMYTQTQSGEIGIISLAKAKLKVVLKLLKKNDELRLAMVTPEGHYKIDQDLINDLHFVKNGEVYPVSSFDLIGNRPDKVYEAIGKGDPVLIETLKKSWETRIRRLGLNPASLAIMDKRPEVKWNASVLPSVTKGETVQLQYKVSDADQSLKYIDLRVNGVPLYGRRGLELKPNTKQVEFSVDVPLHTGRNSISIVAVNTKGAESIAQTAEIFREVSKEHKPALIYIGVGVSEYADSSMNLRYAAKDVADIADGLPAYGDSIVVFTLLNEDATKANILSLKEKLKNTRPDDVVVVSFSGHGTLHKEKGFFFAPHDMNFKQVDKNGVSMEMIENLLDSIPAFKRLLLLDACHSGEESRFVDPSKLPEGVTATITRGSIEEDDQANGSTDNSYFLMKELFNDLSRGNGAFMISAAASNEFAFEGDKWENGVFTMSFLQALRELRYSGFNGKEPVSVKDLRKLIYEKVTKLTNGLQNPTSRQENGWWNWSF